MNKSNHFTGQPVFLQLIKLIPKRIVNEASLSFQADRYCKGFDTWSHLVTMLFASYGNCTSLREVSTGMRALEGKLQNTGMKKFPARSTFSDANLRRSEAVFEQIYYKLKAHWERHLPDSRSKERIKIFDSTSISLFKEIFRGSGLAKQDGRRKGGLKVHVTMGDGSGIASSIMFTDGARNDMVLLPHLKEEPGDMLIFDRGYRSYIFYKKWTDQGTLFVTRLKDNTYILKEKYQQITAEQRDQGIKSDKLVKIGHPTKKNNKINARIVRYIDPNTGKEFKLLTNHYEASPMEIARLYKKRWQIELLFKRMKQNMPLTYFLGDNQNAIKIQIWCAFIADFLLQLVRTNVKRKWSYSNIVNVVRLHLFNYLDLIRFLRNPDKCAIRIETGQGQQKLSLSG
jgi:hypothetical protein